MVEFRWIAASAALWVSASMASAAPGVPHYRVTALPEPEFATAQCLPGYARRFAAVDMNDLGIVSANFTCYSLVDQTQGYFNYAYLPYVAATYLGAHELALPPTSSQGFVGRIDNLARAYGELFDAQGQGTIWSLGAGPQRAFNPFGCQGGDFEDAMAGNLRGYVLGYALRTDPNAPWYLADICITIGWVIRAPDGTTSYGPVDGAPSDINDFNVAVGQSGRAGIKVKLPGGQQTILNPGDAGHSAVPISINERGQVAGFLDVNPEGNPGSGVHCASSAPVMWDADGTERALPLRPGDTSARTSSIGQDGRVTGDSGSGRYCGDHAPSRQRAVLWVNGSVYDLNTLIPASSRITLTSAAKINRAGQIAVVGYRNDDPLVPCPDFTQPTETEFGPTDFTLTCRDLHSWVLTPTGSW